MTTPRTATLSAPTSETSPLLCAIHAIHDSGPLDYYQSANHHSLNTSVDITVVVLKVIVAINQFPPFAVRYPFKIVTLPYYIRNHRDNSDSERLISKLSFQYLNNSHYMACWPAVAPSRWYSAVGVEMFIYFCASKLRRYLLTSSLYRILSPPPRTYPLLRARKLPICLLIHQLHHLRLGVTLQLNLRDPPTARTTILRRLIYGSWLLLEQCVDLDDLAGDWGVDV